MSRRLCVLVVDDDRLDRAVARDGLTDAGFSVVEAASGPEAIALLAGGLMADALFTDILLGGGADGFDVALAFSEAHPGKPVIYASGFAADEPRRVRSSLFFPKPYRPSKIAAALQALLTPFGAGPIPVLDDEDPADAGARVSRLMYVSRPTALAFQPDRWSALAALEDQCARANARDGLTGALFAGQDWFAQVLEGPHAPLFAALGRITCDPRHRDIKIFEVTTAPGRLFGQWSMFVSPLESLDPAVLVVCLDNFERPSPASARAIVATLATASRTSPAPRVTAQGGRAPWAPATF